MIANLRGRMDEINWHFVKAYNMNEMGRKHAYQANNDHINFIPGFERFNQLGTGFALGHHPPIKVFGSLFL